MNVKRFSWLALVALFVVKAAGQPYPLGVRSQAMAGAGTAHAEDAEAIFANPALLSRLPGASATFLYSRPFGLDEIKLVSAAAAAKVSGFACGLAVIHFGDELYRDRYVQATVAHQLANGLPLAVAAAINVRHLWIRGYGSALTLGLNLGTVSWLSPKFQWGVFLGNVNQPAIGAAREKTPQAVSLGVAFFPRADWTLQLDFHREYEFSEELRFGVESRALRVLHLRLGAATGPDRFTAGFAIILRHAALHLAATSHSDLGTTVFYAISLGRWGSPGREKHE